MDLSSPTISRELSKLIQFVDGSDRVKFREDAKEAKNIEEFLEKFRTYKKIGKSN